MSKTSVISAQEISPRAPSAMESGNFIEMIERLATNPATNVDTLDRLLQMQERVLERQAKAAYTSALVEMKPKLPVIDRRGRIIVREKTSTGKRDGDVQQDTPYARWEDIDAAITPILHDHGFVLTFRTEAADGKIVVTAVLSHRDGHEEKTSIPPLPFDTTGSKNNVQAVGSSLSYGKRYAATLLLNIRTKGEDDDGVAGAVDETITGEQAEEIKKLIETSGASREKFLEFMGVKKVEDLLGRRFREAKALLNEKASKKKVEK